MPNALEMLRQDHEKVKGLYRQFSSAGSMDEKKQIVDMTLIELQVHADLEEEIFYPAVDRLETDKKVIAEAEEEHHAAELLIKELAKMKVDEVRYPAKYTVLMEEVLHHIEEEEREVFPRAQMTMGNRLDEIGRQMEVRKPALMTQAASLLKGAGRRSSASRSGSATRSSSSRSNGRGGSTSSRSSGRTRSSSSRSSSSTTRGRASSRK